VRSGCHIRRRAAGQRAPGTLFISLVACSIGPEGAKSRNQLKFTNSDLKMLRVFREFLIDCMHVDTARVTLRLNVYTNNGLSIEEIEQHWLAGSELPASCVRKHALNHTPTSSSGRAKKRLRYGV
jgi:hypothetical protein